MPKLGVTDRAKVIQKALALAKIATDNAAEDDAVTVTGADGKTTRVLLSK